MGGEEGVGEEEFEGLGAGGASEEEAEDSKTVFWAGEAEERTAIRMVGRRSVVVNDAKAEKMAEDIVGTPNIEDRKLLEVETREMGGDSRDSGSIAQLSPLAIAVLVELKRDISE